MARKPAVHPRMTTLEDRTVPTAEIVGMVYGDSNLNNQIDEGEIGLTGITVELQNPNTGATLATATTNADGRYRFEAVPAGNYKLAAIPTANITPESIKTTTIRVAAATTGPNGEATTEGRVLTAAPIGLQPNGRISGAVFTDLNADGIQQANEPGFAGVILNIDLNADGTNNFTVATDTMGKFVIGGLPDGVHTLGVNLPLNHKATTSTSTTFSVTNGSAAPSFTVGLRPTTGVAGRVVLAASEGARFGLAGITVGLDTNGDGLPDRTTTTDLQGNYLFANVPAGQATVLVQAPTGAQIIATDGTSKTTVTVTNSFTSTQNLVTVGDLGVQFAGSVRGQLYLDANSNGKRDDGERAVQPGQVQVDVNGSGRLVTVRTIAQADGSFRVDGLPDGKHFLVVTPGSGTSTTDLTRIPFTLTDGSTTTNIAIALRGGGLGSTLTISNGSGSQVTSYSFTKAANGQLVPNQTRNISTPNSATGGTRSIAADFNGDGIDDIITATGPNEPPLIRIYDGRTGAELVPGGIAAFEASFKGGINLTAGDFDGDGKAEIVAAADVGGGPRVRIFNAAQFLPGANPIQGKLFTDFFAIEDTKFRGGVRVTVGDLNGDGTPDLAVAAGVGGGPRVAVYDGKSLLPGNSPKKLVADFFAFEPQLRNGATIAIGDVNGDGIADLVAGAGSGGAPRVTVFSGQDILANMGAQSARIADYFVNGDTFSRSGTRISVKDVDGDSRGDVVASNGERVYIYTSLSLSENFISPRPNGPRADVVLDAFSSTKSVFLG